MVVIVIVAPTIPTVIVRFKLSSIAKMALVVGASQMEAVPIAARFQRDGHVTLHTLTHLTVVIARAVHTTLTAPRGIYVTNSYLQRFLVVKRPIIRWLVA